ncbi:DUF2332 domain-containing protein [Saliphagus sp. GCM10025334]
MDIAEKFGRYANWVGDTSPFYARLADSVVDDDRLLGIASAAREGQPEPELLLAAVHSLLLAGRDHPLAQFYPTCERSGSAGDPVDSFRDFCVANEDRLQSIVATRRCQTNDVGRSAVLLPAFEHVARTSESDALAQVEIGASAGLNLNWDRYRYDFDGAGRYGETDSPVTIATAVRGDRDPPLPRAFPTVVHRRGVDLNTLDVTDDEDARWLHALIHPNRDRRHRRLAAAIEMAKTNRPPLVEGDALEALPALLSDAPDGVALVVFSTHVLYQLDAATIAKLRSILSDYSSEQPIHWLSIDPNEELGEPTYRLVIFEDGNVTEAKIARFEPYGRWVQWLDS